MNYRIIHSFVIAFVFTAFSTKQIKAEGDVCDISGNWRVAGTKWIPELIIDEPPLADGQTTTFEQEVAGPKEPCELELIYVPGWDIDPDHPGDAIQNRFEDFQGLKIDGKVVPLSWKQNGSFVARCPLTPSADGRSLQLEFTWHDTRPPQTRLLNAKFSAEGTKYQGLTPPGEHSEVIVAHGVPFLSAGASYDRYRWLTGLYSPFASPQGPTKEAGLIVPWNDGKLDAGDAEVDAIHFLGMIHVLDWASGSWYATKGDHSLSHFVGDKVGEINLEWSDGGSTAIPLILGWNVWYGRPWDMVWHFNQWGGKAVNYNDQKLFDDDPKLKRIIPESLALVDGIRPRGSISSNGRFIFSVKTEGRRLRGVSVKNVPELRFGTLISAVTLEVRKPVDRLKTLPQPSVGDAKLKLTSLDAIEKKTYQAGVDAIMHLMYTFVDELPRMTQPEIPAGYFGPRFDFGKQPDALYAATYLYYNGPGCAAFIADSGMGCSSLVAKGMLIGNYIESSGVWISKPPHYGSIERWAELYRKTPPGEMKGIGDAWSRAVGEVIREAAAFGYDKFLGTYTDWLDRSLMTDSTPPHWSRCPGLKDFANINRQVGDVFEKGNRENDGHGICMWGRYMAWHFGGRSREWNEKHFDATAASVEWIQWQLDTDTVFPGVRKDVLYTESECAHGCYDFYSSYNCLHGLKLAIRMAEQLDRKEQVERWKKLYERLQKGILDNLVERGGAEPIWYTYPHCDWQDHAHKLAHLQLATDGDTYTPLQDYARGDEMERKYLEIDRATYRYLMRDKNYNCLRMYGYGQGMMTQSALLLDEMADAEQFVKYLVRHAYLPHLGRWASPEGIMLHRSGKYYVAVNGYAGEDSHLADSTKAVRLMLGVDDNDPKHLRLVPRFPAAWTPISIADYPAFAGAGRQKLAYIYNRSAARHEFEFHLERDAGPVSVRLGPLPPKSRIASATLDGKTVSARPEQSGDSEWCWIEVPGGKDAKIAIELEQ